MSPFALGLSGFVVLCALLALRAPIGIAVAITGVGGIVVLKGWDTALYLLGTVPIEILSNYALSTLPLFILMGNVAVRAGLSQLLYEAIYVVVGRVRGGLAIATIIAAGGFSAVCGSSLACASTMAQVAAPQMLAYRYSPRLVGGSIAAGGTLGIMIPPSTMMIIYAYLTENSIGQLFIAGIVPGCILIVLFSLVVVVWTWRRPEDAPLAAADQRRDWKKLFGVLPVLVLFAFLMGGIFVGLFTPTEGAAMGAAAAIVLAAVARKLTWPLLFAALRDSALSSAVIYLIIIGTAFYQFFMEASRLPTDLAEVITGLDLNRYLVMIVIMLALSGLGCLMESLGIMFLTVPVLYPLVTALGFDPIWFGIVMVLLIEFGLITPPVGLNVFVLVSLVREISMRDAFIGIWPFLVAMVALAALLLAFPQIALFLPQRMGL